MRLLLIFLTLVPIIKAQQVNIGNGVPFNIQSGPENDLYIKGDTSGFFMINSKNSFKQGECHLVKIAYKGLIPLFDSELHYGDNWNVTLLAAVYVAPKLFLYLEVKESSNKKVILIRKEYDGNEGKDLNIESRLDSLSSENQIGYRVWKIIQSRTEKTLYTIKQLNENNLFENRIAAYLNETGEKKWEYTEIDSSRSLIRQFIGDDKGRLYALYKNKAGYFGVKSMTGDKANDRTRLLPVNKISIFEPALEILNGKLYCSGEFMPGIGMNKEMNETPANGFFLLRMETTSLEIKDSCYDDLNQRLQNKLNYKYKNKQIGIEGEKNTACGAKNYLHYGMFSFKGAVYAVKYHANLKSGKVVSRNEIIILKYNQGKPEWMQIIPGNNTIASKMGFEFIFTDKMHLFYFDHKDNLIHYPEIGFYSPKKYKAVADNAAILVRVGIDERGSMERDNIFTYVEWQQHIYSDIKKLNEENSLIIGSDDGRKRRFDKLSLVD